MKAVFRKLADFIRESDKILVLLCLIASSFGCISILSATQYLNTGMRQFLMQVICMILGLAAAFIISAFDYKIFSKYWFLIALVGLIPVVLTFFIGYAPGQTDDQAWLRLPGGITFQPSELLKICFTVTFAYHVNKIGDNVKKLSHVILLCIHGAIPVLLIHFQGDDGSALIIAFMFIGMMFVAGVKLRYFILAIISAVVASPFIYFFVMNDDQKKRISSLLFPTANDYIDTLWQQYRGRIAMANGGLFGKGFGNGSMVQSGSVPLQYNDFIIASIGEEFGIIGCVLVFLLLTLICIRILIISKKANNQLGSVICAGIFSMFLSQIIINIGMCLSLLPVIGVTLPMFSAGGTSLLCLYLGIGLVLSVYMHRDSSTIYARSSFI